MDFRIAHRFPCSPQAYWEATRDPVYERSLQNEDMDSEVIERREEGDILTERMRVSPKRLLPPLLAKAIGRDRLSYVQEVAFNNAQLTTTWKVLSDVLTEKVKCSGTSRVIVLPEGCERIIEGSIDVSVFIVGGAIEKHILGELERGYDRAAALIISLMPERS